jgi:multidrug efflux pump subunit AcrA (membrane-fusion protein)
MFAQSARLPALMYAVGAKSRIPGLAAAIALALSACSSPLPSNYVRSADPSAATPAAVNSSVVRGYISQRPVEPGSWLEQNQNVAPRQKR